MKNSPPRSATNYGINLVGVACSCAALAYFHSTKEGDQRAVFVVCAAGVVPIIVLEMLFLRVHLRPSTGLDWSLPDTTDWARVLTKLLGLGVTVGGLALGYFVFPEYGKFYDWFFNTLRNVWPTLVLGAVGYVWFVDGRMKEPRDAYWQLGRVFLFHTEDAKKAEITNHVRSWLIKGFFLPLFVVFVHNQLIGIIRWNLDDLSGMRLKAFSTDLVYALDVLYATMGYILSFRLFDSHVRSAEPTLFGWVIALECYDPFWRALSSNLYLHYEGIGFETWLRDLPTVQWAWAIVILVMETIYLFATFSFGIRFSNLTNRGIFTNGPYRFTKHPAYVAKNISWWMTTVPFIPHGDVAQTIKSSIALAGVSAVYFWRARTEERHLSRDPDYVAYATWMNEHGMMRFLNRIPGIRYVPPALPQPSTPPAALPASEREAESPAA